MQANYETLMKESDIKALHLGSGELPDEVEINSRFGKIKIRPANAISFPRGLVGIPECESYCITDLPSEKMARFKLLQSTTDQGLSFLTLPVDVHNEFIAIEDIDEACNALGVSRQDAAVLLVVSVHRGADAVRLSVNCVAPIIVDSVQRVAVQYVYGHSKYQIRRML